MPEREHQSTSARFKTAVILNRSDNEQLAASLSLGVGILMGSDFPGTAAAVGVAYERLFPEQKLEIMPEPDAFVNSDGPGAIATAAWHLIYNMVEAGTVPDKTHNGVWWEQDFIHLRKLLEQAGFNTDPAKFEAGK